MNDQAWAGGMSELMVLPSQDETPERAKIRGLVYRRELGGLSDDLWLRVVRVAIQRHEWMPPVAKLLEYAKELYETPSADVKGLLPEDTRSVEERRADSRRMMAYLRDELTKRGFDVSAEPAKAMR